MSKTHIKLLTPDCLAYVKERYEKKYVSFDLAKAGYEKLKAFKICENIFETNQNITEQEHYFMRLVGQYYMEQVFSALLIDKNDENVKEDLESNNIGTPGRIVKTWTGANLTDESELMSGRWVKEPRMADFKSNEEKFPVFVETTLDAVCSHHAIRFGNDVFDKNSIVVVGYYPDNSFGGISKINRYVRWCATRGWLQESLTNYIGKKIQKAFKSESVYVAILKAKHGCASYRGALDKSASTSTVFIGGKFKGNLELVPSRYRG